MQRKMRKPALILPMVLALVSGSCNPFAPGLDSGLSTTSIFGDPTTIDGVFQNIAHAYTFRDTSIYGPLVNANFAFVFRDYDRGVDVSWGRDEELRTTSGLFQAAQRLDLVWNNIVTLSTDSAGTKANITRNFNLTVTFNPSDVIRVDGYANFAFERLDPSNPWKIVRWQDQSNF